MPNSIESSTLDDAERMELALNSDLCSVFLDCWDETTVKAERQGDDSTSSQTSSNNGDPQRMWDTSNQLSSYLPNFLVEDDPAAARGPTAPAMADASSSNAPPASAAPVPFPGISSEPSTENARDASGTSAVSAGQQEQPSLGTAVAGAPTSQPASYPVTAGHTFSRTEQQEQLTNQRVMKPSAEFLPQNAAALQNRSNNLFPLAFQALVANGAAANPQQAEEMMKLLGAAASNNIASAATPTATLPLIQQQQQQMNVANPPVVSKAEPKQPPPVAPSASNNNNATPPFLLFDAPVELRANFMQSQRAHGLPVLQDNNSYHYNMATTAATPFHPMNLKLIDARHGQAGRKREKNAKEQKRAQQITTLIEELRLRMEKDGWKVELKSKFHTLSS